MHRRLPMKPRRLPVLIDLAAAAVVFVAACGSSDDDDGAPVAAGGTTATNDNPHPKGDDGATPPATDTKPKDDPVEGPPTPYQHYDINHVLSTGQSNSVAHEGRPVLTTTQPYGNLMFN